MRILQAISTRPVVVLAFGAGRLVAGSSGGYEAWDLAGGETKRFPMTGTATPRTPCVVDPRGRWFYTKDGRHGCRILPLDEAGPCVLPGHPDDGYAALAASPDGRRLVMSRRPPGITSRLECWEIADPWRAAWAFADGAPCDAAPIYSFGKGWWTQAAAYSPDGRHVGLLEHRRGPRGYTAHLLVRDAASGALASEMPAGEVDYRATLHFLSDGRRLAVLTPTSLAVWGPAERRRLSTASPDGARFRGLAVHPSGRLLAAIGRSHVAILHPESLREIRSYKWGIRELHCLAFNEDGTLGAVGGTGGQVALWDVDD